MGERRNVREAEMQPTMRILARLEPERTQFPSMYHAICSAQLTGALSTNVRAAHLARQEYLLSCRHLGSEVRSLVDLERELRGSDPVKISNALQHAGRALVPGNAEAALYEAAMSLHRTGVARETEDESLAAQKKRQKQRGQLFIECGAPRILMDALWRCKELMEKYSSTSNEHVRFRRELLIAENECLCILRDLSLSTIHAIGYLRAEDSFVVLLFEHCLRNRETFESTVTLIEELLALHPEIFDLRHLADITALTRSFSRRELSIFCRVIAPLIFQPDSRRDDGPPSALCMLEKSKARASGKKSALEKNHETLVNIPFLLKRLVSLLSSSTPSTNALLYNPEFQRLLQQFPGAANLLQSMEEDERGWEDEEEEVEEAGAPGAADFVPPSSSPGSGLFLEVLNRLGIDLDGDRDQSSTATYSPRSDEESAGEESDDEAELPPDSSPPPHSSQFPVHQVELLFVLCTLLGSSLKHTVQDQLASLGLVKHLLKLFGKIDWRPPHPDAGHAEPPHGAGCECEMDGAFKVQLLRVVLSFADRDGDNMKNKRLLLSSADRKRQARLLDNPELDEEFVVRTRASLQSRLCSEKNYGLNPPVVSSSTRGGEQSSATSSTSPDARAGDPLPPPPRSYGLLPRVVHTLKVIPCNSINCFWLASCVESFLRGSNMGDQVLFAHLGLMEPPHHAQHLVATIVSHENKNAGASESSLQTSCDTLGELVKFNPRVFLLFDAVLTGDSFKRLTDVLVRHLVDSNVLLRGVFLTIEHIMENESEDVKSCLRKTKVFGWIQQWKHWLVSQFISAMVVEEINQENVCCLNTALVYLTFERARGTLEAALTRAEEIFHDPSAYPEACPKDFYFKTNRVAPLENLRALLWYWKQYYRRDGRDARSLAYSSRIPFDGEDGWLATVRDIARFLGRVEFRPHVRAANKWILLAWKSTVRAEGDEMVLGMRDEWLELHEGDSKE